MSSCFPCISLKRGVRIIGFLSLIICIIEWVLSTTFNANKDSLNQARQFKEKTKHIFSILRNLTREKLKLTDEQETACIETFTGHTEVMFNCVTGKLLFIIIFPH